MATSVTITTNGESSNYTLTTGGRGPQGDPGEGVPAGGTTGQVLVKASGADHDTVWDDVAAGGAVAAGDLTGTTLASNVTASSLTSVGTLTSLAVSNPINGSITGNAATVTTNANLTGHITSTGNAAVLGSFTIAQLNTAISDADVARGIETKTANFTAVIGGRYIVETGTSVTVTDPTGTAAGDSYEVWIGSGSCVLGGTTYSPSRFSIRRHYNGSSWATPAPMLTDTLTVGSNTWSGSAFSGAQAFSSTTRPTSAGTGTPTATSLITRADADNNRRRYRTFQMSNFTGCLVAAGSSGAHTNLPFYLASNTPTVVGAFHSALVGNTYLAFNAGADRQTANFSKAMALTWDVITVANTSTQNEARYLWPVSYAYTDGRLTTKGFGFITIGQNIYGCAHDGTTHRMTSAFASSGNVSNSLRVESDGAGSATFYVNGASIGTLTAPTGTQTGSKAMVCNTAMVENPAANAIFYVCQQFTAEFEI